MSRTVANPLRHDGQILIKRFAARSGELDQRVYLVSLVYPVCLIVLMCVARRTRETNQARAVDRPPLNPPSLTQGFRKTARGRSAHTEKMD